MKRLKRTCGMAVLAAGLAFAAVNAQAAELTNVNSLGTESGNFTFGYVTDGEKAHGPFMIDTATGRAWIYERMEKKHWRLVPVEYVGDDGAHGGYLPGHEAEVVAVPEVAVTEAAGSSGEADAE